MTALNAVHECNFIGGKWSAPVEGGGFNAISPSTGEHIALIGNSDRHDARLAVKAAGAGHAELSKLTNWERAELCLNIATQMELRREKLANILSLEQGKPLHAEAFPEVDAAIDGFRQASEMVKWLEGEFIPAQTPGKRVISFRQARGVYGIITPWNFPFCIPVEYLAPCLATGNGVVWVPSPSTALCAIELMKCIELAGLPDGAINLVIGPGNTVGDEVVTNPGVHAIGLTGSPDTGNIVARRGAGKPMVLELGGNGPLIVLDDADLERAAAAAAFGCFFNAGQVCAASGRILTTKKTHNKMVDLLVSEAKKIRVGLPLLSETMMGSLHNETVVARVENQISDAISQGAQLASGGHRLDVAGGSGLFFEPTILANVSHDALANTAETFGPLAPVVLCEDENHMMEMANASGQGLAMAVFTSNISKAFRFGEQLQSGLVNINSPTCYWELHIPFGGYSGKQSGVGRVGGKHMLQEVTQVKTITFDIN